MSEGPILRREGYWPSSPVVGRRGAATRARIVAETLRLSDEHGFHNLSVDRIVRAAETSRATLYQYFESKEQIFVELLSECGAALSRVVRRLGPLGPTEEGFDNLHWWVGEWAWVYDKYATIFVQWAGIDTPATPVRPLVLDYNHGYVDRIARRLASSGVEGLPPEHAAVALVALVHRVNHYRHRGTIPMPPVEEVVDDLAVLVQRVLFPSTSAAVFTGRVLDGRRRLHPVPEADAVAPSPAPGDLPARSGPLGAGPRAEATVAGILRAGADEFAIRGYHAVAVDDLVAAAGCSRATFYKYFADKLDVLRRLSVECAAAGRVLTDEMAGLTLDDGGLDLRRWLGEYLAFHRRYRGVLRAWVEDTITDPGLLAVAHQGIAGARRSVLRLLAGVPVAVDADVLVALVIAVIDRLPVAVEEYDPEIGDAATVALMAAVVERSLPPSPGP